MLNVQKIRKDFPILKKKVNNTSLIYFDNAATSQKPKSMIDAMSNFYYKHNANVHRGIHAVAEKSTELYEEARSIVAHFIHAESEKNIVFTKNATESINLVAYSWARHNIKKGDEILVSYLEHHSNFLPWQQLCKENGAILRYIDIDEEGNLDMNSLISQITHKTKLIAITAMSNVLGNITPVKEIIKIAHKNNIPVLIDACQAAAHTAINVQEWNADFVAFSGHKMCGPTGIGVLYVKEKIWKQMHPFLTGGGMVQEVSQDESIWLEFPHKLEAGTPPIAQAIGLAEALRYLENIDMNSIHNHEKELVQYTLKKLSTLPYIRILGPKTNQNRGGILSFTINNIHPHDIAAILDDHGIAIRAGHHCAKPLMKKLKLNATARISFYFYNTKEEIDTFIKALEKVYTTFQ